MARRRCSRVLYYFHECGVSCVLSDGCSDRSAMSGLRDDAFSVFSYDGQIKTIHMDAPDGDSDCLPYFLFSLEQIYTWKERERNEAFGRYGCHFADCPVLRADVSLFPGQTALCLYER